jgi:hypothetical protein
MIREGLKALPDFASRCLRLLFASDFDVFQFETHQVLLINKKPDLFTI